MAYLDRQPVSRKLANLGTASAIELALAAALIAGLSITVVPPPAPPDMTPIDFRDKPPPETPKPQAPTRPIDSVITAPVPPIDLTPIPQPLPTAFADPLPFPIPSTGPAIEPRPQPSARFTPVSAAPRNAPSGWVTTDDYPRRELIAGHQGVTRFRVIVGSNGRVQSCEVTRSSGFPALDKTACDKITGRARFDPATDETGAKVVGSYTSSVVWQIPR